MFVWKLMLYPQTRKPEPLEPQSGIPQWDSLTVHTEMFSPFLESAKCWRDRIPWASVSGMETSKKDTGRRNFLSIGLMKNQNNRKHLYTTYYVPSTSYAKHSVNHITALWGRYHCHLHYRWRNGDTVRLVTYPTQGHSAGKTQNCNFTLARLAPLFS